MNQLVLDIKKRLSLPLISAPMFLISGPELVISACKAGIIGSFPTLNARPLAMLDEWMTLISDSLAQAEEINPGRIAPWAANLIIHSSNERAEQDLDLVVKHRVPIVISALGSPRKVVDRIHSYGGLVFSDVSSVDFAKKAADAGADGLILIAAGAGGHTGDMTAMSFVPAVREFFNGPILLGGGIIDGRGVRAAEVLGADFAYMGTRFIATEECAASDAYKQMLVQSTINDITLSSYFTGINANYLVPSIRQAGIDPSLLHKGNLHQKGPKIDFDQSDNENKVWRDIWSAGQGVGNIKRVMPMADVVAQLKSEYLAACETPVSV